MSKSMLIIDTPSSCDNCPLCILLDRYSCTVNKRWCGDEQGYFSSSTMPTWCPLKEEKEVIPIEWIEKQVADGYYGIAEIMYHWEFENNIKENILFGGENYF